ncbi:restriction endonuclease subunit S [Catenibacterium sp.]|uniref:restriction endonuclease subunit S n=1 Tax=Catenibacterium sp. TaxID=2049022 RepID=UPI003999F36B
MKYRLEDICSFRKEKVEVSSLTLENYISTENMLPNKAGITKATSLPKCNTTQRFECGDVLVSNIRPYFKKIWKAKFNGGCSNDVLVFSAKKGFDSEFLYYVLSNDSFFDYSMATSKGTKMPRGDKKSIMNYEVHGFDINIQIKIASILKSIDEKIEMNNAINNNLEQQIEMILLKTINGTDTQPVKLGDYLYIKGRIGWKGLKKSEYLPISNYRIINGESLTLSGIDWNKASYISAERYEESPEIMLSIGDILLSKDGTIGKIGYVDKLDVPTSVASGIFVIRNTRESEISTQFIYYLLKSKLFKAFISSRTEGSVIPHLYQKDFMEFEFKLPSPDDMKAFDSITATMFSLVFSNLNENERLTHLRNSLLPNLMSGELDVSNIDI